MRPDELTEVFDKQAAGYDTRWLKLAPIRDAMFLLLDPVLAALPPYARVLAVGVGTGMELADMAKRFPHWTFMAVDPSSAMLAVCRQRAQDEGFIDRCEFHEGFLETLPPSDPYDAATCLLVSQFLLNEPQRIGLFRAIADRLRGNGLLISSDLASGEHRGEYDALLRSWVGAMSTGELTADAIERARTAYSNAVAILAPSRVAQLIAEAGFVPPVQFFQAGLLHAWSTTKTATS